MQGFIADFHALREARRLDLLQVMNAFLSLSEATHWRI